MWKTTITDCWRDGLSRDEQKRLLLLSFGAVFLFGLAAHAYGFLRAGFSHDMLNALVVEPVETYWKMQLGRPGPSPVESREAPPTSSFPGFSEPP